MWSEPKLEHGTSLTPHASRATHVRIPQLPIDGAKADVVLRLASHIGRCLSQFERPGKPDLSLRLELVGRQAFSKASIRLAMRSPSDRARDRYAGTSWHGARGPPGACVGRGSGPGSKCRQGKRATDLSGIYQAGLYSLLAATCCASPRSVGVAE